MRALTRSSRALQQSGKPITDFRNGVVKPRIQLLAALAVLLPERPFLEAVTPGDGGQGQQLTVTVTGTELRLRNERELRRRSHRRADEHGVGDRAGGDGLDRRGRDARSLAT